MAKSIKRALHVAHIAAATTLGMAISGMDEAPAKPLLISCAAFILLLWSYHKIYRQPEQCRTDTPIDEQVRRDLGIKD
jgi:hypothetical protein